MHEEFFDDDSGFVCSDERPADISQADLDEMLRDAHERDDDEQSEQVSASQDSGGENCHDYYITNSNENKSDAQIVTPDSNTGTSRDKRKKKNEISDEEYHRRAARDIDESKRRLSELPSSDRRGLDDETYQQLGFGFLPNWKHPKNPDAIPTPRFIARLGDANDPPAYNAILTPSGRERFGNSKLWEARKCLTAVAKLVFHPSALTASLVAITEGELDTASVFQSLKRGKLIDAGTCSGVDVCALGGTDGAVEDLIKRLEAMEVKPRVILLFDGDDTGRTDDKKPGRIRAAELQQRLWAIDVVAVCEFFEDVLSDDEKKEIGDKPDANQILKTKGDDYLYYRFARIVKKAQGDFKQAEEEMKRWREYEQTQSTSSASDDLKPSTRENQSAAKGNYDPEIQNLIDEINNTITCEMLEQKGIIEHSKRGKARPEGYVCFCGSGTKKEKTGELCFTKTLPLLFRCRACGKSGNVLTLLSKVWSIPRKGKEFFDLLKKTADEFGIHYDPKIFDNRAGYGKRNNSASNCDGLNLSDDNPQSLFSGDASDDDFAQRMVYMFGNRFRYLKITDEWFTFESTQHGGGLWENGGQKNSTLYPFATELAKKLAANAHSASEQELAAKFKSTKKKSTTIAAIKGISDVIITLEDLNTHNNLLNVMNGVVDLETGKLYPAEPSLLITQQAKVIYREGYRNEIVDGFLKSILPDEETLAGLMRYLGYAATGECSEEKALFCNGGGGNGKGTLTKTLMHLFGDYAATLKTSAVLLMNRSQDAGAATTELNPLINCRVAIVEELPQGGRLDVAKFKNLTGGDMIPMRLLHQEQINVEPHFSPILSGNYLPELSDTRDPGLKRRLLNIVFEQTFAGKDRDPKLKAKLSTAEALSGLLTIVVTEAVEWYKHGLIISAAMEQATKDYLDENDFLMEFVEENCERGAGLSVTRKDFLDRLKNGDYAAECLKQFGNNDRALTSAIKRIEGIEYRRSGRTGGNAFVGIGWKGAPKQGTLDQCTPISPDDYPPF